MGDPSDGLPLKVEHGYMQSSFFSRFSAHFDVNECFEEIKITQNDKMLSSRNFMRNILY